MISEFELNRDTLCLEMGVER